MTSVGIGVWLASAYAILLVLVGHGIDLMARRAARTIEAREHAGFVYHESHDAWLCPEDQWLWPQAYDPENRVMRYRANPLVCNSCPVKDTCTASGGGREVVRAVDSWPASEAARFHRGIACTVACLGIVWPIGMILSGPNRSELVVLLIALAVAALASLPLWSHLRRTPARFPESVPADVRVQSLDETLATRSSLAREHARRRTHYASDRRGERLKEVGEA